MSGLKIFFVTFLLALSLTGCASLGTLATDIKDLDATTEIAAISNLTDDFVKNPWDNILQIGLGYFLALLRRKYKVSKGAK